MLQGHSSVFQALLGTFFTWGMTAAGAALVFVFSSGQRRILDGSLGFAAGVMLAASYWSLLAPAVEMATSSGGFGAFAFFPVAVGFTLGAAFVYLADLLMPHLGAAEDPQTTLALNFGSTLMKKKSDPEGPALLFPESELSIRIEGLAVGVGFGAIEKTASATFESARQALLLNLSHYPVWNSRVIYWQLLLFSFPGSSCHTTQPHLTKRQWNLKVPAGSGGQTAPPRGSLVA
ncbi:zinc transporter ZIP11 isoform X15 [Homo sapiens]|uniref:zinc transporter ZIP11 isoform X15 n=1 Tax=Homo sapiens TaxID=9606 RepID=UPI001FB08D9E|nr:zinc transporter ZIP11 isoform X15 [Homo sapiens]